MASDAIQNYEQELVRVMKEHLLIEPEEENQIINYLYMV